MSRAIPQERTAAGRIRPRNYTRNKAMEKLTGVPPVGLSISGISCAGNRDGIEMRKAPGLE